MVLQYQKTFFYWLLCYLKWCYIPLVFDVHDLKSETSFNCIILLAGIHFVLPCIDDLAKVDLRTITINIPPQEVKRHKNNALQCQLFNEILSQL